jgi:hypothetical protein
VKIETVHGMTRRVNHLDPKPIGSLVLIKHGSCYLFESPILSFVYLILLWSVGAKNLCLMPSSSR